MLPVYSNSKMGSKGDNRLRAACHGGGLTSYRTDTANTFCRPTLPEPWGRIPGKWGTLEHGDFGAMGQKPREMGHIGTWSQAGTGWGDEGPGIEVGGEAEGQRWQCGSC